MSLPLDIARRLATTNYIRGDHSMGEFELASLVAQVSIMAMRMIPLAAARNGCNNAATTGWTDSISTSLSYIMGVLLRTHSFTLLAHNMTASIFCHS